MLTAEMTSVDEHYQQEQREEGEMISKETPAVKALPTDEAMKVDAEDVLDAQAMTDSMYAVHGAIANAMSGVLSAPEAEVETELSTAGTGTTNSGTTNNGTTTTATATATNTPPTTNTTNPTLLKEQLKYCQRILKGLKRHRDASPFLLPVDPVALNIPDYFTVVKHPMDLSTVQRKMDLGEYGTPEAFMADVALLLNNCFTYNGPDSQVAKMGRNLEKYFNASMSKMPTSMSAVHASAPTSTSVTTAAPTSPLSRPRRESHGVKVTSPTTGAVATVPGRKASTSGSMSFCGQALREMTKKQNSHLNWPFMVPVDPVALGIPDYFTVIKHPMDLSTIRKKLESGVYTRPEQFEGDVRLMFANCYGYNQPDTEVARVGRELEAIFDAKWAQKPQPKPKEASSSAASMGGMSTASSGVNVSGGRSMSKSTMRGSMMSMSASQIIPSLEAIDDDSEKILTINEYIQVLQAELGKLLTRRSSVASSSMAASSSANTVGGGGAVVKRPAAPRKKPAVASPTTVTDDYYSRPMTFEEKRDLSEDVGRLASEKLMRVLEIIQECMPNLRGSADSEVIELDIEALDVRTLRTLQAYINECLYPERKRPAGAIHAGEAKRERLDVEDAVVSNSAVSNNTDTSDSEDEAEV